MYQTLGNVLFIALLQFALTALFVVCPATAGELGDYDYQGKIGNWGLFSDGNTCWMATRAIFSWQEDLQLEEQMLFITFFNGLPEPKVSFYVPDCCDDDHSAKTRNDVTPLIWFENFLYPYYNDADEEFLMRLLNSFSVALVEKETNKKLLSFSLLGIKAAYSEVAKTCDFLPLNPLRDADDVYKG
jgi:hypothetical protein